MYFLIEHDELFGKHDAIWDKISVDSFHNEQLLKIKSGCGWS